LQIDTTQSVDLKEVLSQIGKTSREAAAVERFRGLFDANTSVDTCTLVGEVFIFVHETMGFIKFSRQLLSLRKENDKEVLDYIRSILINLK
jgi:hypothetical protein